MSTELGSTNTFVTGAIRHRNLGYFASQDDRVDKTIAHSHFYGINAGQPGYVDMQPWCTVSMTITRHPLEQMLALSPAGEIKLFGSGRQSLETIDTPQGSPGVRGDMRKVRTIGKRTYAAGMDRQVYRRDGENLWVCLDQEIRPDPGEVKGFEAIDGYGDDEICAAGWDGELWRFDGKRWKELSSPTNQLLTSLLCAGNGLVHAAGRRGLLLKGRGDAWQVVEPDLTEDIWDMAWFEGRLYVSTYQGVYVLQDERLVPVDFGSGRPTSFHHLSEADGILWSIGAKDIFAFDGHDWSRLA